MLSSLSHAAVMMDATSSGGGDPYWPSVSSLLHFDGNFTDQAGPIWTPTGVSIVSTPTPQFGSGCASFVSTQYITTPTSSMFGFGSGDFTLEGWVYSSSLNSDRCMFDCRTSGNQGCGVYCSLSAGGVGNTLAYTNNAAILAHGGAFRGTSWDHWAIARQSGTVYGFIRGALVFTVADTRTFASSTPAVYGANSTFTQSFTGYLDECRVTKGVARYTTSFTPPTAPFPNHS